MRHHDATREDSRSKPQHGRNAVMVRNYAYGSNHHGSRLADIHPETLTRRPQQPHGCTPGNSGNPCIMNKIQNRVPVIDAKHRPLAPCSPRRARILVQQGKAHGRHRNGVYYLALQRTVPPESIQSAHLMIDPGKSHTGLAIVRDDKQHNRTILFCATIRHRNDVKKRLTQRASFRRTRRGRLRFRKPRFSNRRRPAGWLPPSLRSRLDNTLTWIYRLTGLMAISEIHVETAQFDAQRLRDPRIHGKDYQQGPLYQTTLRAFVIHRDNSTCRYCGKKAKPSELDHVVPRSLGGPNTPWNLVVACHKCNRRKDNQTVTEFLRRRPQRLADIEAQLQKPLASAAHMNVMIPELLNRLRQQEVPVTEHDAAQTAANRQTLNVEKDHHIDAAVLGEPTTLHGVPSHILAIKAVGRGQRKRIIPDKSGTPRSQDWPNYCRLSPAKRRKIPTPGHKNRRKRIDGIGTGDLVQIQHASGTVRGHATPYRNRVSIGTKPARTAYISAATLIARHHGYATTIVPSQN